MDFYDIFVAIEASPIGTWVRDSSRGLPLINAVHIIAVAMVFGTIFIVDLRLLGVASRNRAFTKVATDLLKWTWIGFALAVVTGLLLFAANATTFYSNTQFWFKMGALALAGINMFVFELVIIRNVEEWDTDGTPPVQARISGLLSIGLWCTVIVFGRWIGYTKGWNFSAPSEIDLDNLFFGAITAIQTFQIA